MKKPDVSLDFIRHSLSHLLASAVLEIFPDAKLGVGPVIANGFYYDFLLSRPLVPEDLHELEKRMRKLVDAHLPFVGESLTLAEAKKLFKDQPFKLELLHDIEQHGTTVMADITESKPKKNQTNKEKTEITIYRTGNFVDLCRGGHIASSEQIPKDAFALTHSAGAYWRGNEKNPMLQRIYGVAFLNKSALASFLQAQEEAKKRDHRQIGKDLDLFTFSELVGSGLPLYTPNGSLLRRSLNDYIESLQSQEGYTQVWTPQIAKASLFKISGHYDKYKDGMFRVTSQYGDEEFFLKPMNCPQHTQIYASKPRSYRDLPIRYTDFAMLYRDEKPGELSGLARVRAFSQDDCHIFCREDQVDVEIDRMLSMTKEVMATFGFSYYYRLSTRDKRQPKKFLGDPKMWDKVEQWAVEIMKRNNIAYKDGPGEAAFYAPKMDLMATDALGREWQLSTIQIDFVLPERFGLEFTASDGSKQRPVMLHRAIIGSPERFLMILLEHFAGALPLWLAPTQVAIIPVGKDHAQFSQTLAQECRSHKLRTELFETNETVGYKIRAATKAKIPYILVIGDQEMKSNKLAVRIRGQKELATMDVQQFYKKTKGLIASRSLSLA